MFEIKDTVIHPTHGVCEIYAIQNRKKQSVYVLRPEKPLPGDFKILIPKTDVENSGVRYPITKRKIVCIFRILAKKPDNVSQDSKKGFPLVKKKIQSGNLYKIAEVIRDLKGGMYPSTRKEYLLECAKSMLIEEIAYVRHIPKNRVNKSINRALK